MCTGGTKMTGNHESLLIFCTCLSSRKILRLGYQLPVWVSERFQFARFMLCHMCDDFFLGEFIIVQGKKIISKEYI